jgi:hypothetical protein
MKMAAPGDHLSDEHNDGHMKSPASTTLCLSEMFGVFAICHLDAAAEIPVWASSRTGLIELAAHQLGGSTFKTSGD